MPRDKRINIPGTIYHVITRGIERNTIFRDNVDRSEFLSRLETALDKTSCQCLGWALMNNHLHLLIRTGKESLSSLMRRILTGYAVYFNRRYKRHGYLYQNRYKSVLCQEDVYLLQLIRYIHVNPVRAGIVKSIEELDLYPWTGHSVIVGKRNRSWQTVDDVLLLFSEKKGEAIKWYRGFIVDGFLEGAREELEGGGLKRSAGGWEGVKTLRKNKEYWRGDERILGDGGFVEKVLKDADEKMDIKERYNRAGWNLEKLVKKICDKYKIEEDDLRRQGRRNTRSEARSVLCALGYKELGISSRKLSEYLRISQVGVSQNAERGDRYIKGKKINLLI